MGNHPSHDPISHQPASHQHGPPHERLAIVLAISSSLLLIEVAGAVVSGSLSLLADAGHMLSDVGGLALALWAARLARRPATNAMTWGFRRAEVLAAAAQAAILLAVGILVLYGAVRRLVQPSEVASTAMLVFGIAGIVGNAVSLVLLRHADSESMNTRAALLEVTTDAFGSFAVVVAAVVLATTGWARADPVASILIGVLILPRAWKLLHETVNVLLEGTPQEIDLDKVREHLLSVDHVVGVHDLHASLVATGLPVLSAHLTVEDACFHNGQLPHLLDEVQACLAGHFDVHHSTFQFELAEHTGHEELHVGDMAVGNTAGEGGVGQGTVGEGTTV